MWSKAAGFLVKAQIIPRSAGPPLLFSASYCSTLIGWRDEREKGDGTINQWMKEGMNTEWEFKKSRIDSIQGRKSQYATISPKLKKSTFVPIKSWIQASSKPLFIVVFPSRQVFDTCHPPLLLSFPSGCCRSSTFCVCSVFESFHPCIIGWVGFWPVAASF